MVADHETSNIQSHVVLHVCPGVSVHKPIAQGGAAAAVLSHSRKRKLLLLCKLAYDEGFFFFLWGGHKEGL